MPLTVAAIRNAKPREKAYKLFDGRGMYLEVSPRGGKWWRLKYRLDGKERRISLGVFPDVTLAGARTRRDEARALIDVGIDPSTKKAAEKARVTADGETFETVAREWFERNKGRWAQSHASKIIRRLEADVFPWLGPIPVSEVTAPEALGVLRRIESRGALETAHRAMQNCSQIFRFAVATGRAERDPMQDLRGALPPAKVRHFASVREPREVGELLRAIDAFEGTLVVRCALRIAPLVFVRPGELRGAEWSEINTEDAEWRIAPDRMKMRAPHIVPLSKQVIDILTELRPLTADRRYVFPSVRTWTKPISENTINAALRRIGYDKDQMTGHGFRSIASTLLNEQGWNRDAIERQLAHAERDSVRAAYNYAEHLPERRRMMQAWADYLDQLRAARP